MPRGVEEFDQALAGNGRRFAVHQRVKVERLVRHHGGVKNKCHPAGFVVDRGERGHRAGLDAECLAQELGRAEGEAAAAAQTSMQRLELDHGVFERCQEYERPLLVLEKQIFGMRTRDAPAQCSRLLDREQRNMRDRPMRDAKTIEQGEQVLGRGSHYVNGR